LRRQGRGRLSEGLRGVRRRHARPGAPGGPEALEEPQGARRAARDLSAHPAVGGAVTPRVWRALERELERLLRYFERRVYGTRRARLRARLRRLKAAVDELLGDG